MYDIEGWEMNEGSGDSGWLNDVMSGESEAFNYEPGYSGGESVESAEPANYVPPGYSNPAWDTPEHFAYQPGTNYETADGGGGALTESWGSGVSLGEGSGSGLIGAQGSGVRSAASSSSPRSSMGSGSGRASGGSDAKTYTNSGSWLNDVVTTAITSARTPTKAMPTMGALPTLPAYNENKIRGLRQKYAAPGINKLRGAVSSALTQSSSIDNPYLRKMLMKSSLEGFGAGLGNVMTSAEGSARTAYDTEYKGNLLEYNNEVNRQNTIFQAAMQDYLNSMTTTETSTRTSNRTGGSSKF